MFLYHMVVVRDMQSDGDVGQVVTGLCETDDEGGCEERVGITRLCVVGDDGGEEGGEMGWGEEARGRR